MNVEFKLEEYLKEQFDNLNKHLENKFNNTDKQFEEIKVDINNIKTELKEHREEEKKILVEVESVRGEIHKSLNSNLKWTVGSLIGLLTLISAIALGVARYIVK